MINCKYGKRIIRKDGSSYIECPVYSVEEYLDDALRIKRAFDINYSQSTAVINGICPFAIHKTQELCPIYRPKDFE